MIEQMSIPIILTYRKFQMKALQVTLFEMGERKKSSCVNFCKSLNYQKQLKAKAAFQ